MNETLFSESNLIELRISCSTLCYLLVIVLIGSAIVTMLVQLTTIDFVVDAHFAFHGE